MKILLVAALVAIPLGVMPVSAPQNNWGQEVKSCNESDCYPNGSSRGEYVLEQARDAEGPGYAKEIHTFANPGKAEPKGKKF
ncbi:hypothetical protein [Devosia sp. A449]